mmetsp:Transcript_28393/g.54084  ORF Transcript_28393/g.54084 Transcript_28393/m.54084 type:complete len:554 (+) Transcript_28393:173-1834(+)
MSRVTFKNAHDSIGQGVRGFTLLGTLLEDIPNWQENTAVSTSSFSGSAGAGPSRARESCGLDVDVEVPLYEPPSREGKNAEKACLPKPESQESKFPVNKALNRIVRLWEGPCWMVKVDAVVNSTTIHMEPTDDYQGLYEVAGPGLAEECRPMGGCRTGEAKVSGAHGLPCANVIHTVGPRYVTKYKTAAENALCHAYRGCLEALVENNLHSISMGCIHLHSKGYPREEAAHVALRTVRRFLEKYSAGVEAVVLAVTGEDYPIFLKCMPLYFPRTKQDEESAKTLLPENTGNDSGEVVLEERDIRISAIPAHRQPPAARIGNVPDQSEEEARAMLSSRFTTMTSDPDHRRAGGGASLRGQPKLHQTFPNEPPAARGRNSSIHVHKEYLAKASRVDVTDIGECKVLFKCGLDFEKRPVVVMVGAHLDPIARCNDLERFLVFAVKELQEVCQSTYSIVYFHAEANATGALELGFVRKLHAALGPQHKDHLKALYVVHPTFALKAATATLGAFGAGLSKRVWKKAVYVDRLDTLFQYIPAHQLHIPDFVSDFDRNLD